MPSGGARARSGPAPDPNALRRDRPSDKATWTRLPAAGREGETPPWPLSRATRRELEVWAAEWRRPQAVMWEANGQQLIVALFVRAVRFAENASSTSADRVSVIRYLDDLGISNGGLARNRWVIDDAGAPARQEPEEPAAT